MRSLSVRLGAAVLIVAAVQAPRPARAFGLHFGPIYFHLPFRGGHRHKRIARSEPTAIAAPAALPLANDDIASGTSPTLLYPALAWPSLYDAIFEPGTSSWPFGYQTIFDQAFMKFVSQQTSGLCPYRDTAAHAAMQITRLTAPTVAQKTQLEKLATALGQANGYLVKSCPAEIPAQPVARLQLMDNQIDAMIMALDIVRPRLQAFAQSLDEKQRARLNGSAAAESGSTASCKPSAASVNEPLSRLEQAVQPTEAQRPALAAVADALNRAAAMLDANCSAAPPPTALGRLERLETWLDAMWRAVQTIQVGLASFQAGLSDEQNSRLNALQIANTR